MDNKTSSISKQRIPLLAATATQTTSSIFKQLTPNSSNFLLSSGLLYKSIFVIMVEIGTPFSIWVQLSSFCFLVSGVEADLLVLRVFLFSAYVFLFLNTVLGGPMWPEVFNPDNDEVQLDSLLWALACLYVHGYSLVRLLLDERKVTFASDEEEALWHMFYRTSGQSARLFKTIISPYLEIIDVEPGQDIPVDEYFYIVYSGRVLLKIYDDGVFQAERIVRSSQAFDINALGLFITTPKENVFNIHKIVCSAGMGGPTRLFRFRKTDMTKIAHEPFCKGVLQTLLINNLSFVVESYSELVENGGGGVGGGQGDTAASYQKEEQAEVSKSNTNTNDDDNNMIDILFSPLQDNERPHPMDAGSGLALKSPFHHIFRYVARSFSPPWPLGRHPTGIRQTLLPVPPHQKEAVVRRWSMTENTRASTTKTK